MADKCNVQRNKTNFRVLSKTIAQAKTLTNEDNVPV